MKTLASSVCLFAAFHFSRATFYLLLFILNNFQLDVRRSAARGPEQLHPLATRRDHDDPQDEAIGRGHLLVRSGEQRWNHRYVSNFSFFFAFSVLPEQGSSIKFI